MSYRQRNMLGAEKMSSLYVVPLSLLIWLSQGNSSEHWSALPWHLNPELHRGLRRQVTPFLCSVCFAEEESQMVIFIPVARSSGHWPAGKRSKTINSFSLPMNGEGIDLIQELELTMPYPQLLIYSFAFLVT